MVTIKDVLGSAYPHQSLSGSRYQHNATSGGIPLERSLSPPCTITNITGAVLSPFVQINGVSLYGYGVKTTDCSGWYSKQNGGHRYPGNQTFCTDAGQIITLGTTSGYMKIEIDRDWLGRGYCGPNVPSCNNETLGQEQSNGSISLDMQGFVFWEGPYHWELHPLTAWKLSNSPPPPPPNSPPSVDFSWSPTSGNTSTVFSFTAQVSDDHDSPDSVPVRWDWTGDGTWDTGWSTTKTASHTYSSAGNKTVVVQAIDSGGLTSNRSHQVQVTAPPPPPPPNNPPSVDFSWSPTSGDTGTVFTFTATASDDHDPPNTIQVRWDWTGDGTWDTSWSTTKTATHTFSSAGNKTVFVQAVDSGGLTASASHIVQVTSPPPPPNAPPSVDFTWTPSSGDTSTVFTFTATASDDHDPPNAIQVRWDWTGDGTWDTSWSTTKTASHTFSSPGNYTVVVQAKDSGGLTASASHVIPVSSPPPPPNAPPSVDFTWTPTSGDTNTVFTFTAQVTDDHDPPNTIQVRWDWTGDGTWDTTWSTTKTVSHTFSSAGTYTVVVQAKDSGGLTASASHMVSVTSPPPPPNGPPTVDFTWTPTSGDTSTVFTFTATASDDHDPPNTIQVRWDWTGDGTWDTTWSTTKTVSHTFSSAGTYTVVVQAIDSGGLTAIQSHTIIVTAPPPPGDFSISASPASLTIVCGSSGSSGITLTSLNGLSGTASLSASISSSGLVLVWPTVSLSPSSVTLPSGGTATSTLTVSTSVLTTPGTYTVTVTATIGSITHSADVTVVVTLM
ncbi:MAG: PKD domain-containing protein [Methanobacteriota archaeon]|nr:MAG: PKD domain-containing protein [Euryarchaeota archaeon]